MKELLQLRHNIRLAFTPEINRLQAEVELILISRQLEYKLQVDENGQLQLGKHNGIETVRLSASIRRLEEIEAELSAIIALAKEIELKAKSDEEE